MYIEYIPRSGKLFLSLAHPCILTSIRFDTCANHPLAALDPGRLPQEFPDGMARSPRSLRFIAARKNLRLRPWYGHSAKQCGNDQRGPTFSDILIQSGSTISQVANRAEAPGQFFPEVKRRPRSGRAMRERIAPKHSPAGPTF